MFLLVYLFVHSEPMDRAFYGVGMRHQDTPAPRVYPLLLLAVGCKHAAPRFRSPRVYPLLLLAVGHKHTAPSSSHRVFGRYYYLRLGVSTQLQGFAHRVFVRYCC